MGAPSVVGLLLNPASGLASDDKLSQLVVDEHENPKGNWPKPPLESVDGEYGMKKISLVCWLSVD